MFFKGKASYGRLPAAGREWEKEKRHANNLQDILCRLPLGDG